MSARRENGLFDFRNRNSLWEQLTLDRAEFEFTEEYFPPMMLGSPEGTNKRAPSKEISPKVSVIIPMYNAEKYIEACLDSILNQTFQDYEVIIVDDCSTDRSAEIVENMSDKFDGRLNLIRLEKNNGEPGTPRNIGINVAVSKYIYFVDSDDLLMPHALDLLYNVAENYHADFVDNLKYYSFTANKELKDIKQDDLRVQSFGKNIKTLIIEPYDVARRMIMFIQFRIANAPWHKFLRRSLLVENKIEFSPTFSIEDTILSFQCAACAKIYVCVPDAFYLYRRSDGSLTAKKYSLVKHIEKHIKSIDIVFRMINTFMNKKYFFERHPQYKFMVFKRFFDYCVPYIAGLRPHYESNSASYINDATYKVISEGIQLPDPLIANSLTATLFLPDKLMERNRKIGELKTELRHLRAIKNPAD